MGVLYIDADEKTIQRIVTFLQQMPEKNIKYHRERDGNNERKFNALKLATKNMNFDREEAHER